MGVFATISPLFECQSGNAIEGDGRPARCDLPNNLELQIFQYEIYNFPLSFSFLGLVNNIVLEKLIIILYGRELIGTPTFDYVFIQVLLFVYPPTLPDAVKQMTIVVSRY